jgi:(p)ppGpp synthase/HD superfamily hydrolase
MASNRAAKSGFAAEAHSKINSKYDTELSSQVLQWMRDVMNEDLNTSGEKEAFYETLKDGTVLCRCVTSIKHLRCISLNSSLT